METAKHAWAKLEKPIPCRTTRRRILLTDGYLRLTAETFYEYFGRPVLLEEAREIAENVLRWLECLLDGEKEPPLGTE